MVLFILSVVVFCLVLLLLLLLLGVGGRFATGDCQCNPAGVTLLDEGRVEEEKADVMATDDTTMGSPMPPRLGLADEWAASDVRSGGDRLLYSLALRLRPKPEACGQSLARGYSQVIRYWGGATLELYLRTALHAVVSLLLVVYSRAPSP